MRRSYKYRIYPTKSQASNLENQFSMCRYLYNWSLEERIQKYEKEEKSVTYRDQSKKLPELKAEKPWFKGVYSQVLQDVLNRLDGSFQSFFSRVKEGNNPGFPKFKKKGQWDSITYPQFRSLPENKKLKIPKVGDIKIQYHRSIPYNAKIKTLTVKKEGARWFVSFSIEIPFEIERKPVKSAIGIDLGLIFFYKASDGSEVFAPKFFRKSEDKLKKLQKRLSKAEKLSPRYHKTLRAVQKTHHKIKNQRLDFLHKTANDLLKKSDAVMIENLNIKGMIKRAKPKQDNENSLSLNRSIRKSGLNKSILDASWYSFRQILEYKADALGKTVKTVAPHYTSQKCCGCGEIVKKSLSTRTHKCYNCGLVMDRDENAANNILGLGLESLGISSLRSLFFLE